jgi:hypothetical protein
MLTGVSRRRARTDDVDQRAVYAERVQAHDKSHPGYSDAWHTFANRVLDNGGSDVVPPLSPDPLIDMLSETGVVVGGAVETLAGGPPSQCHANAVRLWRDGRAAAIGTGYALSEDGLWREHSWGISDGGAILETTEARTLYFGIEMRDDFAQWFVTWIEDSQAPPSD